MKSIVMCLAVLVSTTGFADLPGVVSLRPRLWGQGNVQALIDAGPKFVIVPPGIYSVDRPVELTKQGQTIVMQGVTITASDRFVGDAVIKNVATPETRRHSVTLIGPARVECGKSDAIGILSDFTGYFELYNIQVNGSKKQGIIIRNAFDAKLIDCKITKCGSRALQLPALELSGLPTGNPGVRELRGLRTTWVTRTRIENFEYVAVKMENAWSIFFTDNKIHGMLPVGDRDWISDTAISAIRCRQVRITNTMIGATKYFVVPVECVGLTEVGTMSHRGNE